MMNQRSWKSRLLRRAPQGVKNLVLPYVQRQNTFKKNREIKTEYQELGAEHIENTELLLTRFDLLDRMPKGAVCGEIGVDQGGFSEEILSRTQPQKLHLIDVWHSKRYPEQKFRSVSEKFSDELAGGKVVINRGYSTDVLPEFPDHYFDWVYLDSGHGYALTRKELALFKEKVKPNGIIAGHDYCRFSHQGAHRFGVVEAVNKFCVEEDYELLYLTMETHRHVSFAIRRR